jgi:type IV pilus modification protein PilV
MTIKKISQKANAKGFTIIEVLVAMGIFTVAILGVAISATSVIKANQVSYSTTIATNLAQDKLEDLKANPTSVASGSESSIPVSGETFSRTWTVTVNSPVTGVTKIDVAVTWTDYTAHTVTLSSVVGS